MAWGRGHKKGSNCTTGHDIATEVSVKSRLAEGGGARLPEGAGSLGQEPRPPWEGDLPPQLHSEVGAGGWRWDLHLEEVPGPPGGGEAPLGRLGVPSSQLFILWALLVTARLLPPSVSWSMLMSS